MSDFPFEIDDIPLSETDEMQCINDLHKLATTIFGPIGPNSQVDSEEKLVKGGRYYKLTRFVSQDLYEVEHIQINLYSFSSNQTPQFEMDGAGNIFETIFYGNHIEFSTDISYQLLVVSHYIGTLTLNGFGEIEPDYVKCMNIEPIDPARSGGIAVMSDLFALQEARQSLTSKIN